MEDVYISLYAPEVERPAFARRRQRGQHADIPLSQSLGAMARDQAANDVVAISENLEDVNLSTHINSFSM